MMSQATIDQGLLLIQKLIPYPDYHTEPPLSYEPLGLLMVWRLLSLGGCFPIPTNPFYFLNYDLNGRFLMLTIHSNLF